MGYELWLLEAGSSRIEVIRALREVGGAGPVEAKRALLLETPILEDSALQRTLEARGQLEKSGARVWVRQLWDRSWFGIDRQAGFQQRINTVMLRGQDVELWSGSLEQRFVLDGWDDTVEMHVERFESADEAKRWAQQKVEALRREGASIEGSVGALYRALTPRAPELEASVRAAPEDAARVYSDWLIEQGDPRGILLARASLDTDFEGWFEEELKVLLGPLWEYSPWLEIEWRHGLFRAVKLRRLAADPEILGWVLDSPMALGLRVLRVPLHLCQGLLKVDEARLPPGIFLGNGVVSKPKERAQFGALVSRLEYLGAGPISGLSVPLNLPGLRAMETSAFGSLGLWGLAEAKLPALEHLTIDCSSSSFDEGERPDALDSRWTTVLARRFPALQQLELNYLGFWPEGLWDSVLLQPVRRVLLRDRLERPAICRSLLCRPALLKDKEVVLERAVVPDDMVAGLKLAGAVIQ